MANTKGRLRARVKKSVSKNKTSAGNSYEVQKESRLKNKKSIHADNDSVKQDFSNKFTNKPEPINTVLRSSILPLISKSGTIKRKHKYKRGLKFMGTILKSELMINDVHKTRKTRSVGINNNNITSANHNDTVNKSKEKKSEVANHRINSKTNPSKNTISKINSKEIVTRKSKRISVDNQNQKSISIVNTLNIESAVENSKEISNNIATVESVTNENNEAIVNTNEVLQKPANNVTESKRKTKKGKAENAEEVMEEGLRVEVLNQMKNVLSPVEDKQINTNDAKTRNETKSNRKRNPKKTSNNVENRPKKRKIESNDERPVKMKQVTLSNGVVLTLGLVYCDHCKKSFSNKSSLGRHMLTHMKLQSHKCPHCPRKFRHQPTLKAHLQKYHQDGDKKSEARLCHICNKEFLLLENLELHLATHVKTENSFQCLYCDKKFSYRLLLIEHEKSHLVTGRFKCYFCDMSYTLRSRLTDHIKTHTKIKDYICQYCGKEFLRLNSIKRHVQFCHGEQRIQCPICMKKLKGHLTEHMRLHEQKRPHLCLLCGQRFTQSTQLTVHQRSHTGVRPYPCRICKRSFGHSNALMLHIRRHTGEKPFACAMCPLSFSQLPHMKNHMIKIHGKVNPYKCQKCGEFFKLRVDLDGHSKTCTVGDKELTFEEQIQAAVQYKEVEVESPMSISKMRFLIALLLTMIASKDKLKYLGFNKRLIDELLEESLEAMGYIPCGDLDLSPIKRLKANVEILLNGTVPKVQMEKFKYENKSTEEILMLLTDEKR